MPDGAVTAAAARALLVRVTNEIGFPAPATNKGLTSWADESLDHALGRGTRAWATARAHVLDAVEAAMMGRETGVRAALGTARELVCGRGERRGVCTCPPASRGLAVGVGGAGRRCVKCDGRPA